MIQVHVANHSEADQVWRALQEQEQIDAVELHVNGSYAMDFVRSETGWTSAQREAALAHSCQPATLAAH